MDILKEQKTSKASKKKKFIGADWVASPESLDDLGTIQQTETMTILQTDELQSEFGMKKSCDEIKDENDPNYFSDKNVIESSNYQLSQEEAQEIKEKMKTKLKTHLSEISPLGESHAPLLRNETLRKKKKKKKDLIAAMEPETSARSCCESHGCSDELCQHDHETICHKVETFPKNAKKKSKADDASRAGFEGEREEESRSRTVHDDSTVLGIFIHRSDKLKTDLMVSRPFVKIHIYDQTTGEYVKRENRTDFFNDQDKNEFILPLVTPVYDFKRFKTPVPEWDKQIIINERFAYFLQENESSPKVILFFEIVDLSNDDDDDISSNSTTGKGFQKIAWGFLKLVGTNKVLNVNSRLRLQLYFPPSRSHLASDKNIFDWWLKYPRNPYPSTLHLTVRGLKLLDNVNPLSGSSGMTIPRDVVSGKRNPEYDINQIGAEADEGKPMKEPFRWTRLPGQACRIPNRHLLSLNAGHMGCFAISFSNDGRILAAAYACRDGYPVYLYEIPSGNYLGELRGHLNVVYDLCWSKDDQQLLSSSSDSTVRLWKIGSESLSTLKVLPHPSYVYTAKFHPIANSFVVTGCYDGMIRVWNVRVKEINGQLLQEFNGHKSFINTLCFDSEGFQMYTGDGSGHIIIWNAELSGNSLQNPLEHWGILKEIREPDMKGIPVNHIEVHPNGRRLLIHTKDSTLRVMDLRILSSKKYIGTTNYREKICSAFTPCGTFIFAGSEDGMAYVWNTETGDKVAKYSELSYSVPLRDVAFHPHENLVAFCAFGPSQPILVYIYDYKVAQMEGAIQVSGNLGAASVSENILMQDSCMSVADTLGSVGRTSIRLLKVKQKLDSVLNGTSSQPTAPSLLSPHSKIKLSGTPSTHLITPTCTQHGGFSPIGHSLSRAPSIRLQMNNRDAIMSSLKIEADVSLPVKETVVVLYDYTAHRSDELTIHRSDIIHVLYKDNDNWWFGSLSNGHQGYFPANYVAIESEHENVHSTATAETSSLQKKYKTEENLKGSSIVNTSHTGHALSALPSKSKDFKCMLQYDTDANSPVTHASRHKIQHLMDPKHSSDFTTAHIESTTPETTAKLSEWALSSKNRNRKQKKRKSPMYNSSVGQTNNAYQPDV